MESSRSWPDTHTSRILRLDISDCGDPDDAVELNGVTISRAATEQLRDELSEVLDHFDFEYGPQKRPAHQD